MSGQRILVPAAAAVAGVALLITAALYTAAFMTLSHGGPNPTGYGLLLNANDSVVIDAVLISVVGGVLASVRGSQFVVCALGSASAVTLTAAAGAQALGSVLANLQPTKQPIDLHSINLAVEGSGATIMPAPVIFAAGGARSSLNGPRRHPHPVAPWRPSRRSASGPCP